MIRNALKKKWVLVLIIIIISCRHDRVVFENIIIPRTPVNFMLVNSEYDDYNTGYPGNILYDNFQLYFSSNRDNYGQSFDIIYYQCELQFDQSNAKIYFDGMRYDNDYYNINDSNSNELGPFFYYQDGYEDILLYSSDRSGNSDIYYYDPELSVSDTIAGINSSADDAYPTIRYASSTLYFCSDREGIFNIYSVTDFSLDDTVTAGIEYVNELNSDKDDKCPYIKDNIMVFTSKRDGGYGGFDLWYSVLNDTVWSEPENFGSKINSSYDEYRPVIINTYSDSYMNNLMVFSSNRPGGKGNFDLYYVGISKTLE